MECGFVSQQTVLKVMDMYLHLNVCGFVPIQLWLQKMQTCSAEVKIFMWLWSVSERCSLRVM